MLCAGTAVEQAAADELQALMHDYAAFRDALTEPQRIRLAAMSNATNQQLEFQLSAPASNVIAIFARASAAVDQCAISGPGSSELSIAPGGLSAMPEVALASGTSGGFCSQFSTFVPSTGPRLPAGVQRRSSQLQLGWLRIESSTARRMRASGGRVADRRHAAARRRR